MLLEVLKNLRQITDKHAHEFESEGLKSFCTMLKTELSDEYRATIEYHFKELQFSNGKLFSAELGKGNESTDYILRRTDDNDKHWARRLFGKKPKSYAFYAVKDDSGGNNDHLWELMERGINPVANTLAQSADHINSFIKILRAELAFYIGCLNLYEQLVRLNESITFPMPQSINEHQIFVPGTI